MSSCFFNFSVYSTAGKCYLFYFTLQFFGKLTANITSKYQLAKDKVRPIKSINDVLQMSE